MAVKKGPGDRKSQVAKAGKRSGQPVYPAAISNERRAAKEQGEQQFVATHQLTVEREATIIVHDKALKGFVERTKKITLAADYAWDSSRGRVISSPKFKEKVKN